MHVKDRSISLRGGGVEAEYAARLLADAGFAPTIAADGSTRHPAEAWAASGGMALTGFPDGPPLMCPAPLASCAAGTVHALRALVPEAFAFDGAGLLGERAALAGFVRKGQVSPGGFCRLLAAEDGWFALNLAREDDWTLIPAWLEVEGAADWNGIADCAARNRRDDLVARGRLLGLAIAPDAEPRAAPWFRLYTDETVRRGATRNPPLVVDLSALWAGPLAAQMLRIAGARVVKVESRMRPDGARFGPEAFFDLLNGGKDSLVLDFDCERGVLRKLLEEADIVIEASRPRAFRQFGIDVEGIVRNRPGLVWVSITGYGRDEPGANWIAFGDDAGVAAGTSAIMRAVHGQPVFCADAVADPLTGLHAAVVALSFHMQGRGGLVGLALKDVTAHCALFQEPREGWRARSDAWSAYLRERGIAAAPPRARPC